MLKDIVVQTAHVPVEGSAGFDVRGLTLTDIGNLIKTNYNQIDELMEGKADMDTMADKYPEFMATVIAMAAQEKDQVEAVMSLPFTTQLTAFEKVWDMTIPDYDALGKLVQRVKGLIRKLPANKV